MHIMKGVFYMMTSFPSIHFSMIHYFMGALEVIHYVKDIFFTTLATATHHNKRSVVYLRKTIVAL